MRRLPLCHPFNPHKALCAEGQREHCMGLPWFFTGIHVFFFYMPIQHDPGKDHLFCKDCKCLRVAQVKEGPLEGFEVMPWSSFAGSVPGPPGNSFSLELPPWLRFQLLLLFRRMDVARLTSWPHSRAVKAIQLHDFVLKSGFPLSQHVVCKLLQEMLQNACN